MTDAVLHVAAAGPLVSIQDGGRPGMLRFGVPQSGPLDRLGFAAANVALGNPPGAAGIEVSMGGLTLDCVAGTVGFAVTGGAFIVERGGRAAASWQVATLSAGERLVIRPGLWGSWCSLAFAGRLRSAEWLGSAATHALSGLGGGVLKAGMSLTIADAAPRPEADIPLPVFARPRGLIRATAGPQQRFFVPDALATLEGSAWAVTDAWDRMGVRLAGPPLIPTGALDMPSEPITRGSVQVSGEGVLTVLLADHQTTGGYPKLATVLDSDLDAFVQLRPRARLGFDLVTPEHAIAIARTAAMQRTAWLAGLPDYIRRTSRSAS